VSAAPTETALTVVQPRTLLIDDRGHELTRWLVSNDRLARRTGAVIATGGEAKNAPTGRSRPTTHRYRLQVLPS
jgi:hypothetical protein